MSHLKLLLLEETVWKPKQCWQMFCKAYFAWNFLAIQAFCFRSSRNGGTKFWFCYPLFDDSFSEVFKPRCLGTKNKTSSNAVARLTQNKFATRDLLNFICRQLHTGVSRLLCLEGGKGWQRWQRVSSLPRIKQKRMLLNVISVIVAFFKPISSLFVCMLYRAQY